MIQNTRNLNLSYVIGFVFSQIKHSVKEAEK